MQVQTHLAQTVLYQNEQHFVLHRQMVFIEQNLVVLVVFVEERVILVNVGLELSPYDGGIVTQHHEQHHGLH